MVATLHQLLYVDKIVTSRTMKKRLSKRQEVAILHVSARVLISSNTLIQRCTNEFADSLLLVESVMTIFTTIVVIVSKICNIVHRCGLQNCY